MAGAPDGNKNNPNIVEAGADTRFGAARGADPSASSKKGNKERSMIRRMQRRLAGASLGTTNPKLEDFAKAFDARMRPEDLTLGQLAAIKSYQQAMGNYKAMSSFIDNVDGKQVEKRLEGKASLADIINGTFEDAEDEED